MTENEAILYIKKWYQPTTEPKEREKAIEALLIILKSIEEIRKYREIGTVEECREAVEKQEAERIEYETNAVFSNGFSHYRMGKCPICDNRYNSNNEINYCSKCGQKLDWSEEDE